MSWNPLIFRKRRIATRTDVPLRHHRLAKSCRQFRSLHPFLRSNNAVSHLLHEYAQVCKRNTAGIGKKGLSPLTTRLPFVRKPTETHNTRYHQLPSAHFWIKLFMQPNSTIPISSLSQTTRTQVNWKNRLSTEPPIIMPKVMPRMIRVAKWVGKTGYATLRRRFLSITCKGMPTAIRTL